MFEFKVKKMTYGSQRHGILWSNHNKTLCRPGLSLLVMIISSLLLVTGSSYGLLGVNSIGGSIEGYRQNGSDSDDQPPKFGNDTTDKTGTTGDMFSFRINVTDNVSVQKVYVEYWFGSGTGNHNNESMNGSGSYTYNITLPSNSTSMLHYIFHANDTSNNWANTTQKDVTITDNDRPIFGTDSTPQRGTTGDSFRFNISVSDNIGTSSVHVEYWYVTGNRYNVTMNGSGPYTCLIKIQSDLTSSIHYQFHASDAKGNWNKTEKNETTITDNDSPIFGEDSTPSSGTTGESFTFSITVVDNLRVKSVQVEYWFVSSESKTVDLIGDKIFTGSIDIPKSPNGNLTYRFITEDNASNRVLSKNRTVVIVDNIKPEFGENGTGDVGWTGDNFTFIIEVEDNIELLVVSVEYWFGNGQRTKVIMVGDRTFKCDITIPSNSTESLHYIFHALDKTGNRNSTSESEVTIKDDDRPLFGRDLTPKNGTTGDTIIFQVSVDDNILISSVFLIYWLGTEGQPWRQMVGLGPFVLEFEIPADSVEPIVYHFKAYDSSENVASTSNRTIEIFDDDAPTFGVDSTPGTMTTGDAFTISIKVRDKIHLDSVHIEYWFGNGKRLDGEMSIGGTDLYTFLITIPEDSLDALHYVINALDDTGNKNRTAQRDVMIKDNDPAKFGIDATPSTGTTGDPLTFRIPVSDNILVSSVLVEYWTGIGAHRTVLLTLNGSYALTIDIPSGSIEDLNYRYHAYDRAGNHNSTSIGTVKITDNDAPLFGSDRTQTVCHLDRNFTFMVDVSDNLMVSKVEVEHWFGQGDLTRSMMNGAGTYVYQIEVPTDDEGDLNYRFHAEDEHGNKASTERRTVTVQDIDGPEIELDKTGPVGVAGSTLTFSIKVRDANGIDEVWVEYWMGAGPHQKAMMTGNGTYAYDLDLPLDSIEPVQYFFTAVDMAGNERSTVVRGIRIEDRSPPTVEEIEDLTVYGGTEFFVIVRAQDNIGIGEIVWEKVPFPADFNVLAGTAPDADRTYEVVVKVFDTSGNYVTVAFDLRLKQRYHDSDGDGLTDLEELTRGTDPDDPDSDSDGMPDGWEVKHGLNPLSRDDASLDSDDDGWTNLEEYQRKSDPTVKNEVNEPRSAFWSVCLVSVVVILLLLLFLVAFLLVKRNDVVMDLVKDLKGRIGAENNEESVIQKPELFEPDLATEDLDELTEVEEMDIEVVDIEGEAVAGVGGKTFKQIMTEIIEGSE